MAATLSSITRFVGANPAGVVSLRLFLPEDVASAPRAYAVPNLEGGITLEDGKNFYSIQPDPRSAGHSDELRGSDHGDYYEQSVTFDVRGLRLDAALLRYRLRNRTVHALLTDICGATFYYPFLRLRRSTRTSPASGYRGIRFELRGRSRLPAPTLNGGLLDDRPTEANYVILEQPGTGNKYRLSVGQCGELITTQVDNSKSAIEVNIKNHILRLDTDGALITEEIAD